MGINQTGGRYPYNFTAFWSDDVNQTNDVGVFVRTFLSNQTIPSSARVVVTSSDNQNATLVATIPQTNRTTSTTVVAIPAIKFAETSVSLGSVSHVSLSDSLFHSNISKGFC